MSCIKGMIVTNLKNSREMDRDKINLTVCPTAHEKKITQFTMGDLHANPIKLIYALIRNGVYTLDEKKYTELVEIYTRTLGAPLTQADFDKYNEIITNDLKPKNQNILVRFIGDSLGDRGANDWFVLKILEKLNSDEVPVRTLVSNHDSEFIAAIDLDGKAVDPHSGKDSPETNGSFFEIRKQGQSYIGLYDAINKGVIKKDNVDKLVKEAYIPTLRIFDYAVKDDHISIMSHAPIDLRSIALVADQFKVNYQDDPAGKLKQTIDDINTAFQNAVKNGKIKEELAEGKAAYDVMWMRETDEVDKSSGHVITEGLKTNRGKIETRNVKNVTFIYGHDKSEKDEKIIPGNVVRLDNKVGKSGLVVPDKENDIAYISDEEHSADFSKKKVTKLNIEKDNTPEIISLAPSDQYKKMDEVMNGKDNIKATQKKIIDALNVLHTEHEHKILPGNDNIYTVTSYSKIEPKVHLKHFDLTVNNKAVTATLANEITNQPKDMKLLAEKMITAYVAANTLPGPVNVRCLNETMRSYLQEAIKKHPGYTLAQKPEMTAVLTTHHNANENNTSTSIPPRAIS